MMRRARFIVLSSVLLALALGALWVVSGHTADQALIDAAKKEGKLVWYTSMPTDPAVAFLEAFRKKYPFLDTSEFYRGGSLPVYNRINIETQAAKNIVDVSHVAILSAYSEWKNKGWLMKYDSPEYAGYPANVKDPGYWGPLRTFALIMAYNTKLLPPNEVPKKWADLTNPKWKGLLAVEGTDSGAQYQQYYALKKILGPNYWNEIAKNKPRVYDGAGATSNALLRDEIRLGMLGYCYGVYQYRELEKAPIQGVWPEEGVPIVVCPLTIHKSAPHPNAAKLFLDWALSREGQMEMVRLVGAYSGRSDVPPAKGNPALSSFKKMYVEDIDEYAAGLKSFEEVWKKVIE